MNRQQSLSLRYRIACKAQSRAIHYASAAQCPRTAAVWQRVATIRARTVRTLWHCLHGAAQ